MHRVGNFMICFIFTLQVSYGQYLGSEKIDESKITTWLPENRLAYEGTYHFGESEGESTLVLFFAGDEIIAQIKSGGWNTNATQWVWQYENLSNVSIAKNGQFSSDKYKGEFVIYDNGEEPQECLKIYNSWSGLTVEGEYELGPKTGAVKTMYPGEYPQASTTQLTLGALNTMPPKELRLMRNEIFARYGYIFEPGGNMEKHFSSQDWYSPQQANVTKFLTTLELQNIRLIQQAENRP